MTLKFGMMRRQGLSHGIVQLFSGLERKHRICRFKVIDMRLLRLLLGMFSLIRTVLRRDSNRGTTLHPKP